MITLIFSHILSIHPKIILMTYGVLNGRMDPEGYIFYLYLT